MNTTTKYDATARIDLDLLKKTTVNLVIFGHGNVGASLIRQLLKKRSQLFENNDLDIRIIVIANSKSVLFNPEGVTSDWEEVKKISAVPQSLDTILDYVKEGAFENLIAIDNTADESLVQYYAYLINAGFHLISSNKKANTQPIAFYKQLRQTLYKQHKKYLYETNVGAGAGGEVTARGVFGDILRLCEQITSYNH